MDKKSRLQKLCAFSGFFFMLGCNRNQQIAEPNLHLPQNSKSFQASFADKKTADAESQTPLHWKVLWNYEDLQKVQDKITYLEEVYHFYKIKIEKVKLEKKLQAEEKENSKTDLWRLSATFYPSGSKFFNNFSDLNNEIQDHLYHKLLPEIKDFEEQHQVKIKHILNDQKYRFELTADWLDDTLRFSDLNLLKNTVMNGYHVIKEDKITSLFRVLRGKSPKTVKTVSPLKGSNALILDGFDDLATALESSQLSRKLVYSIQSLVFYPTFIFLVGSGVEGASGQHAELKNDLKNLLVETYKQELEIKETIAELFSKNRAVPQDIIELNIENAKFKYNILREISKTLKNDSQNLSALAAVINSQFLDLENKKKNLSISLKNVPENIKEALHILSQNNLLLDPNQNSTLDVIEKLVTYKKTQEELVKTFYETKIPGALTESGLTAMYKGMLAFEARAVLNLLDSFQARQQAFALGEFKFTSLLGSVGDAFLAIGQAQMTAGGLVNIVQDINEIHTINGWLELINKSPVFNDTTKPELKIAKAALNDFYRKLRVMTGVKTLGDIGLTAGQFTMLLGGPYGLANTPATLGGAGSTILGVVTKQVAEKIIEANYEFPEAEEGSVEHKIISGEFDENTQDPLKRIERRIELLVDLTQKNSELKVWQNLYAEIEKNPSLNIESLIAKTKKKFLSGAHYHQFYFYAINQVFPELKNISTQDLLTREKNLEFLKKAQEIMQKRTTEKGTVVHSELLFHRFIIQHLSLLKQNLEGRSEQVINIEDIKVSQDLSRLSAAELSTEIKHIFNYADILGFSAELERKLLSRIIKGEGAIYSNGMLEKFGSYIKIENVGAIKQKQSASLFSGINSLASLYKQYYLPNLDELVDPIKKRLPKFHDSSKISDKEIFFFDRENFFRDLNDFDGLDKEKKLVLTDLLYTIFVQPEDHSKIKGKFLNDHRTPIKKIFDSYYKQLVRTEILRPTLKTTLEQLELYKFTENLLANTSNSNHKKLFLKLTANKILNGINGINVGMNILYTPVRIKEIIQLSQQNEHLKATRNSVEIIFDAGDLVVDTIRGKSLLLAHPKVYANLAGAQVGFNLLTAGFSIWQGVEQLNLAAKTDGREAIDLKISSGLAFASAGVSFVTIAAMPFTSFAGPVGAVAGFSLMLGGQIYSTVRFTQSLRELGLNENAIAYYGTLRFFAPHVDISENPDIVHQTYVNNTQKSFLENLKFYNKDPENNSIYISKILYPKLNFHIPYDVAVYSQSQSSVRFPVPPIKVRGGNLLKDDIFLCQVNNIHNFSEVPKEIKDTIKLNKELLQRSKKTKQDSYSRTISYFPFYMESYSDSTLLCPKELELSTKNMQIQEINVPSKVEKEKLTQLIHVGMDQQGKDGQSFSVIKGDEQLKNLFIVNKGQLLFALEGAKKDDIFEIRSLPKLESTIDGHLGRNTFSMQYLEEINANNSNNYLFTERSTEELKSEETFLNSKKYVIEYNKLRDRYKLNSKKNPIKIKNIAHFIGSKFNDFYIGTRQDDFIYGGKGHDLLFGAMGHDVLIGGEGNNILHGGPGSDTYLIYKNDFNSKQITSNEIYLHSKEVSSPYFSAIETNEKDVILTDIDDLGLLRVENDLVIVSRSGDLISQNSSKPFVVIATLKEFYATIELNSHNYPILASKQGFLYNYDPTIITQEVTWLDSVFLNEQFSLKQGESAVVNKQSLIKGISLDEPKLRHLRTAFGSLGADILIGNHHDNTLNGYSGNDILDGKGGDDVLIAALDLANPKPQLQLKGGTGDDLYIIQIENLNKQQNNNAEIKIIEEEAKSKNKAIISINIPLSFENSGISMLAFSNQGHIIFKDKAENNLFSIFLENTIIPQKIQLNFTDKVYEIYDNEMIYNFEYVQDAFTAMQRAGLIKTRNYHEVKQNFIHAFSLQK